MTTRPPFYFAAPYSRRVECATHAAEIESASGWRCTSRWLTGQHDGAKPQQCAADDLEDIWNARAMICYLPCQSTQGGLWVEFGYALALRIPVLLVAEIPPNVFASIGEPRVRLVASLCEAAQALKDMPVSSLSSGGMCRT